MMPVLKVIAIMGHLIKSFGAVVQHVIEGATKTVKNIKSVYLKHMQVTVRNNMIAQYRVTTKKSFGITLPAPL